MADSAARKAGPSLAHPQAVADDASPESPTRPGVARHFGSPFAEQRAAYRGAALIDRSDRRVLTVTGVDRLTWLHGFTTQHFDGFPDGLSTDAAILDPQGRLEHFFTTSHVADVLYLDTAAADDGLLPFLQRMVFWSAVEPAAVELSLFTLCGPQVWEGPLGDCLTEAGLRRPEQRRETQAIPGGGILRSSTWPGEVGDMAYDLLVPTETAADWWQRLVAAGATPAGTWTLDALRVHSLRPEPGIDSDERTIPHEVNIIGSTEEGGAVHLAKGCYRGQETVARVHNLGRPPRRLVLLHLDGSDEERPSPGDELTVGGRRVGRIGTVVDHFEEGPIATALVKRGIPMDTELESGNFRARIDPETTTEDTRPLPGRDAVRSLRGRD